MRSISLRARERWRPSHLIFTKEILYITINWNENAQLIIRVKETEILQCKFAKKYKFSLFYLWIILKFQKNNNFSNRPLELYGRYYMYIKQEYM